MTREWFIYSLSDPRCGSIRYVGFSVNPKLRLRDHIHESLRKYPKLRKSKWIREVLAAKGKPVLTILESGRGGEWGIREKYWIAHLRELGHDLTNLTSGGDGRGWEPPTETELQLRRSRRLGRKHTAQAIANMRIAQTGIKKTPPSQKSNDAMSINHPTRNKEKCKNGHEFTEANTYITIRKEGNGRPRRSCRRCRTIKSIAHRKRKRAKIRDAKALAAAQC